MNKKRIAFSQSYSKEILRKKKKRRDKKKNRLYSIRFEIISMVLILYYARFVYNINLSFSASYLHIKNNTLKK